MLEGGEIINVKREGVSVWSYQVKLDRPTEVGVPTVLATEVTVASADMLLPYTTFSAFRPCRRLKVTVHFGTPARASSVWRLSGVIPVQMMDDAPLMPDDLIDLSEDPTVAVEFTGLQLGMAYGLRWLWA